MKKHLFMLVFFIIFCKMAYAQSLSDFNYIKDLKTYSDDRELRVVVDFKRHLAAYQGPIFYEKSIQIDFPDTYLHPSKRVLEVGDDMIFRINVVQHTRDTVRMRLMHVTDGSGIEERFSLSIEDKILVISIKRAGLPGDVEGILNTLFPEDIIDGEEISDVEREEIPGDMNIEDVAHAEEISGPEENTFYQDNGNYLNYEEPLPPSVPDLFSTTVRMIVSLIIVLSVILIIYYIVKRFLLKGNGMIGGNRLIKVISTNFIGHKKAITLVEVADEVLVLGISNNNISMLTRLENNRAITNLKGNNNMSDRDGKGTEVFSDQLNRFVSDHEKKSGSVVQVSQMIQERLNRLKRGG